MTELPSLPRPDWKALTHFVRIGMVLCCVALVFSSGCIRTDDDFAPTPGPTVSGTSVSPPTPWTTGSGAQYHVAVTGSDANPGTRGQPWATIQHAVDTAMPGDTVYIHGGEYTENVAITISGLEGRPITLMAAPTEQVTVHGEIGLRKGVSHYRLSEMSLDRYNPWGLTLWGDNHHIQIAGMEMTGGDAGIRMTYGASGEPPADGPVSDVTIEDTVVRDVLYTGVDCTPGPCDRVVFRRIEVAGSGLEESYGADGIAVERGKDVLVEDSSIHDNGGDGIDLNSRDTAGNVPGIIVRRNQVYRNHYSGIKLWSGGIIDKNVVWDQGEGPIVGGDYPCTMEIRSNSVGYNGYDPEFGTRGYGLVVGYSEAETGPAVRLTLVNNIVAFTSRPEGDGPTGIYLGPGVQLVEERDNVFYSREDGEIFSQFLCNPATDYDTCDIGRNEIQDGTWARLTGQGQGDLSDDPLFVSPWPDVDLHLKPGSPAAGRGAYG